jgi:hypothetical protein
MAQFLLALSLLISTTALAGPAPVAGFPAPPLQDNELLAPTRDGCNLVIRKQSPAADAEALRAIAAQTWGGVCVAGYAMGGGQQTFPHWWGRPFGPASVVLNDGSELLSFAWDGREVSETTHSSTGLRFAAKQGSQINTPDAQVRTSVKSCMLDRARFEQCRSKQQWEVLSVIRTDLRTGQVTEEYCPRPRHAEGCEPVWKKLSAPVKAEADRFTARFSAAAEQRWAETQQIVERWKAYLAAERDAAARAEAERLAAQKRVEDQRQSDLRVAAEAQARVVADARRAAQEASAAQARAEQLAYQESEVTFANALETFSAGQLYALADEMQTNGDNNRARRALRAIIGRFESHPLAATAVQQLTRLPVTGDDQPGRRPTQRTMGPPPKFSSVCARNARKVDDLLEVETGGGIMTSTPAIIETLQTFIQLRAACLRDDAASREAVFNLDRDIAVYRAQCNERPAECNAPDEPHVQRYIQVLRTEAGRAIQEPDYSIDLGPVGVPDDGSGG